MLEEMEIAQGKGMRVRELENRPSLPPHLEFPLAVWLELGRVADFAGLSRYCEAAGIVSPWWLWDRVRVIDEEIGGSGGG